MLRAYQVAAFGQPLVAVEKPVPTPTGGQVVLAVEACGVCHSDLHIWEGYFDLGNDKKIVAANNGKCLPLTLGHEIVGRVVAVGPAARGVAVGDRRLVYPWIGCGACAPCRAGDEHICQGLPPAIGIFADGGFASHLLVPDARYLVDIFDLAADVACTFACSGLTAYAALKKIGRLGADAPLLIMGAGGVGLNGVRFAKAVTGVAPIVADIDGAKREAALAAGAAQAIDPAAEGALKTLLKATGGVAGAIDFAGAPASFNFAYNALRKGGRLVVVGLYGGAASLSLPLLVMRAVTVSGSYVGTKDELRQLIDLARRERMAPLPVKARPLADAGAALAELKAGKIVGRVVLHP